MLNKAQKSSLSITFRLVEQAMKEIKDLLTQKEGNGILYSIHDDFNPKLREVLSVKIQEVRKVIREVADRFKLKHKEDRATRKAFGKLPYLWEILTDARAQRLRRYGEIADGLEDELDPHIKALIAIMLEMEHLLSAEGAKERGK